MKRVLVTLIATLALAGTAAASDWVCPPVIVPEEPPVVVDNPGGDADRFLYCIVELAGNFTSIDLVKDQPYLDPLDPRWEGRFVFPALVGLPGNPEAVHCDD